jgi:phospholipase/carboxylesterase
MKTIDSTLFHRVLPPGGHTTAIHPTLIMLHGRGADEEDLLGLAPYLDKRLLVVSVRAPFPFPFGGGYTWYDVGAVGTPEPTMFRTSHEKLSAFVQDAVKNYPINPRNLFLLGFSMGTVMSYSLALTQPRIVRGVVANSGYVPEGTHLTLRWNDLSTVEFFVAHGTNDPVIPIQFGRRAKKLLSDAKARFTYKEYPMAHEISEESLTDLAVWLTQVLDSHP